jgi:putative inorganic carbon (HCO3(-)) transporter
VTGLALAGLLVVALPSDFTERLTTLEQVFPGGGETLHPDSSFEKRRLVTRAAWEMFLDHPLSGVGAANYTVHYDRYADRVGSAAREYDDPGETHYPHNLYLEIGAETGVPGLLVFGAAVLVAFGYLRRARRRALARGDPGTAVLARGVALGLVGYLVSSLFLHGQFQRYLWLLFALAAALDALGRIPDADDFDSGIRAEARTATRTEAPP